MIAPDQPIDFRSDTPAEVRRGKVLLGIAVLILAVPLGIAIMVLLK